MKGKAQLSDRFRDFDANLTTRPWIVLGMGLRKFNSILTLKTWNGIGIWLMIAVVYLLTFFRFILFIEPEDYPCVDLNDQYQRCIHAHSHFLQASEILLFCFNRQGSQIV